MIELPPIPDRIARLPKDDRGYPIPWFIYIDGTGKPDFRLIGPRKLWSAYSMHLCWVCGQKLGVHKVYVTGPMCTINRVTSEPACHRECAEFSAKACPFLTNPREKRNYKNLPEDRHVGGIMIPRNPGCVALYETNYVKPAKDGDGYIFRLGEPTRVDWWAEGRQATRAEIMHSIETGYPILLDVAKRESRKAVDDLNRMHAMAMKLVPAEA